MTLHGESVKSNTLPDDTDVSRVDPNLLAITADRRFSRPELVDRIATHAGIDLNDDHPADPSAETIDTDPRAGSFTKRAAAAFTVEYVVPHHDDLPDDTTADDIIGPGPDRVSHRRLRQLWLDVWPVDAAEQDGKHATLTKRTLSMLWVTLHPETDHTFTDPPDTFDRRVTSYGARPPGDTHQNGDGGS